MGVPVVYQFVAEGRVVRKGREQVPRYPRATRALPSAWRRVPRIRGTDSRVVNGRFARLSLVVALARRNRSGDVRRRQFTKTTTCSRAWGSHQACAIARFATQRRYERSAIIVPSRSISSCRAASGATPRSLDNSPTRSDRRNRTTRLCRCDLRHCARRSCMAKRTRQRTTRPASTFPTSAARRASSASSLPRAPLTYSERVSMRVPPANHFTASGRTCARTTLNASDSP
jgi:hypothetical protein